MRSEMPPIHPPGAFPQPPIKPPSGGSRRVMFLGGGALVALVLVVGVLLSTQLALNLFKAQPVAAYLNGNPIDGVSCDALEQTQVHYHAHLQILINGAAIPIPTDVGRQSTGCIYWLHTHPILDDEGVIHIESPDNRTYTLHQFFDIWGQQLSKTSLLGHQVDATHTLTVYVYDANDQLTDASQPFTVTPPSNLAPYSGDPTKIILKPHELIVLEYGTPLMPPSAWTFLAGEYIWRSTSSSGISVISSAIKLF
jgi:hypothetical protein